MSIGFPLLKCAVTLCCGSTLCNKPKKMSLRGLCKYDRGVTYTITVRIPKENRRKIIEPKSSITGAENMLIGGEATYEKKTI